MTVKKREKGEERERQIKENGKAITSKRMMYLKERRRKGRNDRNVSEKDERQRLKMDMQDKQRARDFDLSQL